MRIQSRLSERKEVQFDRSECFMKGLPRILKVTIMLYTLLHANLQQLRVLDPPSLPSQNNRDWAA
jgi:hypothetical protein